MKSFEFLKKYIFNMDDDKADDSKYAFYTLEGEDVLKAEERLGREFPKELREFYFQVGYGFLSDDDGDLINRIMDPESVLDYKLGEGYYKNDPSREFYKDENQLVFFEVSEESFITLDMSKENQDGTCPIYYLDILIANSLKEFLQKMEEESDYFLKIR